MPILALELSLYPQDLLERAAETQPHLAWSVCHTLPRCEKELMRKLHRMDIAFYTPLFSKRNRSSAGRIRTSHLPLFAGYVFVYGTRDERSQAVRTGCICRMLDTPDTLELTRDLQQIQRLIQTGEPVAPEERLERGRWVRVRSGIFAGFEGIVIKRHSQTRLVVSVHFLQQGASVMLDDCLLEAID